MSGTQLIKCGCSSLFQDELYGKAVRLANETSNGQYRCTICSTVSGTKATATVKAPVITAAPPTKAEEKKAGAAEAKSSKASSGSGKSKSKKAVKAGGSKDIKKEPKKKKSMKGTKR